VRKTTILFLASIASVSVVDCVSDSVSLFDAQSSPQAPVSQSEAQHKISINSDLVVLPVTVQDQNGNLVAGLEQKEFRVFDDEAGQNIDVFTSEATPLSLVMLIDDDLKSKDAAASLNLAGSSRERFSLSRIIFAAIRNRPVVSNKY
jgi:hypothetical protein